MDTASNLFRAMRLTGRLNVTALHRAFDSVSARHETLRTVIQHQPGIGPRLARTARLPRVVHTYMRALPKTQREQCAEALAVHHALQPFDLEVGPLWRVSLLKLADDERVLLLCMHRLISDEAFMQVLIDELIHYYRAYDGANEPTLTDFPIRTSAIAMSP